MSTFAQKAENIKCIITGFSSHGLLLSGRRAQKAMGNQNNETTYPLKEDVETINGIIKAYYDVVSGPAGSPRQWVRDNSLHHPDALIVFTGKDFDGTSYAATMNLEEFHDDTQTYENGFWESETHRKTERFGNIAHVWSTYETKRGDGTESKGINSIQLYNDGLRWWIISWMFDSERPDNQIPKKLNEKNIVIAICTKRKQSKCFAPNS